MHYEELSWLLFASHTMAHILSLCFLCYIDV